MDRDPTCMTNHPRANPYIFPREWAPSKTPDFISCGPFVLWTIPVFNNIHSNDRYKMVITVKHLQRKEENNGCTCNHGKWGNFSFLNLSFVHVKENISSFIFASFYVFEWHPLATPLPAKLPYEPHLNCYSLLYLSWSRIRATLYSLTSIKIYIL